MTMLVRMPAERIMDEFAGLGFDLEKETARGFDGPAGVERAGERIETKPWEFSELLPPGGAVASPRFGASIDPRSGVQFAELRPLTAHTVDRSWLAGQCCRL
ncbi:MAG: hypothetical protein IPM84_14915 [Anaerolineae bacterium]|nr:hypothetical protein [Anaerolineae bacterium]